MIMNTSILNTQKWEGQDILFSSHLSVHPCILITYHMEISMSIQHFDLIISEGVIALYENFIKMFVCVTRPTF